MLAERHVRNAYHQLAALPDPARNLRQIVFYQLATGPHAPAPGAITVPDGHGPSDILAAQHPGAALEAALEAIADANPHVAATLRDSGLSAAHGDRRAWRRLLTLVDPAAAPWGTADVLGLLRLWTGSPGGQRLRGAFYTPHRPALTLARLVIDGPVDGAIVDPCCGAGALLVAAHQHLEQLGAAPELVGCDVDSEACETAVMNLAVHGARRFTIHHGDALHPFTGEQPWRTWAAGGPERPMRAQDAGVVLSNPPYGNTHSETPPVLGDHPVLAALKGKASKRGEILHLAAGLAMLRPGMRAGFVVPDGFLSIDRDAPVRRALLEDLHALEGVVSLPEVTFKATGTTTKTSLLLLEPGATAEQGDTARVCMAVSQHVGWTARGQRDRCDLDEVETEIGAMLAEQRALRAPTPVETIAPRTQAQFDEWADQWRAAA
jgi:hypothetical protein